MPQLTLLSERERAAIELAAAQWARSEQAASAAVGRLRMLGVDDAEIERNRRAQSDDTRRQGLLRLAVTLLITNGRLQREDLRRLEPRPSDAVLAEVATVTARAFLRVALVEGLGIDLGAPPLAMAIGDY